MTKIKPQTNKQTDTITLSVHCEQHDDFDSRLDLERGYAYIMLLMLMESGVIKKEDYEKWLKSDLNELAKKYKSCFRKEYS